jgi:hypothetical protein
VDVFQGLPSNSVPLLDIMRKSKEISQDLRKWMELKYNFLAIMTIVMFGGKRGRLAS